MNGNVDLIAPARLVMPGCAVASSRRRTASVPGGQDGAREVFERFVDLLYRRRQVRAAFETSVVAVGFVDHAQGGPAGPAKGGSAGRASSMAGLARRFGAPSLRIELLHAVFEGDIGMVHVRELAEGDEAPRRRVDIYRVRGLRIAEHWAVVS